MKQTDPRLNPEYSEKQLDLGLDGIVSRERKPRRRRKRLKVHYPEGIKQLGVPWHLSNAALKHNRKERGDGE